VQAGQEAIRAIAYEVAIGSERIGVSPTVTAPGKEIFNRIRRSTEFNTVLTSELVFRSDRRKFTLTRDELAHDSFADGSYIRWACRCGSGLAS
jgi:hypothetical protein